MIFLIGGGKGSIGKPFQNKRTLIKKLKIPWLTPENEMLTIDLFLYRLRITRYYLNIT
jgi:hypothetical protein